MTKTEVVLGQYVRTIADRWDVPTGTIGRVDSIGMTGERWCFTLEWLTPQGRKGRRPFSLNVFEEDLPRFERLPDESAATARAAPPVEPCPSSNPSRQTRLWDDPDEARSGSPAAEPCRLLI